MNGEKINVLIDALQAKGSIRFKKDFCETIGINSQQLVNMVAEKRTLTIDELKKLVETYDVNPYWVMGLQDNIFIKRRQPKPTIQIKKYPLYVE
ncbi:helix-turn-helix transcriptional regulator [Myroides odoratimimus]|uniref:helix-turn-helix transcriptional regulator n=1 Tax=Myroides odoratimimus TaxID=76832 RepID=UPI0004689F11|nr:helix-turn-helix transcriptional regulator [Myroides odoratimimus]MDM1396099.1 helix-turn-helix transcriptional regulator [Myroides odoratimimus]